jgi:twitching motility two-component system response regulator PilG
MQGELSEIDVRSILQLVELGQRTGQLLVEPYEGTVLPKIFASEGLSGSGAQTGIRRAMYVFFLNGQIIYAGKPDIGLTRLRGFLTRYRSEAALDRLDRATDAIVSAPEYGSLWALLENRTLSPAEARDILHSMVQETLFDLLSLRQGHFIFEMGAPLSPQLDALAITPVVTQVMQQVQEWKQWHPQIHSPEQVLTIMDGAALEEALPTGTLQTLLSYIDGETSLRQIARLLNRDIGSVTRALYPCVQRGWIQVSSSGEPRLERRIAQQAQQWPADAKSHPGPCIACLDDASTVRLTVENILQRHGYQSVLFEHPVSALSQFFDAKPDLILCDITMPELDGYEICAMLRQSTLFRQTPIVMLTGRDGFIDRVRAQMVGATDYLAKPFGEEELVTIVEKYVGQGVILESSLNQIEAEKQAWAGT